MSKKDLKAGRQRFEFRPGVGGFPNWEGLDLRSDPAAIPPNKLRVAKNVRFWGKDVIARGGQSKLNTTATTSGILGIFDTSEEEGSEKLWGAPVGVTDTIGLIWY